MFIRQWAFSFFRLPMKTFPIDPSQITLKEVQPILTFSTIAKNSDWSSQWSSMRKDHGAKLGRVVCKIMLQKYISLWIDPSDVLVFTAYLGMDHIFTDKHCMSPREPPVQSTVTGSIKCNQRNISGDTDHLQIW